MNVVVAILVLVACATARHAAMARTRARLMARLGATGLLPTRPPTGARPALARRLPHAPPWLPDLLAAADLALDPVVAWASWLAAAGASALLALVAAGPPMAVVTGLAVAVAPAVGLRAARGRAAARLEGSLPGALEAVARSLRSGASLRLAVAEAARVTPGPLGAELGMVSTAAAHGQPLVVALDDLAARRPLPGVRLAVAALCLGLETGGAQARAVDGVATTLRDRLGVAAELRALSSQARVSALVIGLAPVGFAGFAAATDPRTATFLFRTAPGLALLVTGLVLDAVGWWWMRRLAATPGGSG
jgi:tight adherence protein B